MLVKRPGPWYGQVPPEADRARIAPGGWGEAWGGLTVIRLFCTNVMGRAHVSLNCYGHGTAYGHTLWSASVAAGSECPEDELTALAVGSDRALRAWERGEWDFTDDCLYGPLRTLPVQQDPT